MQKGIRNLILSLDIFHKFLNHFTTTFLPVILRQPAITCQISKILPFKNGSSIGTHIEILKEFLGYLQLENKIKLNESSEYLIKKE